VDQGKRVSAPLVVLAIVILAIVITGILEWMRH
jgi:hypothetical protein